MNTQTAAVNDQDAIRRSMLWSAYGDALGFITELSDKSTLVHRTGGLGHIDKTISWRRKIGGMYGIAWDFEPGSYSDDTQMRLAVCRAIRGNGYFDVETFAKVEVPIFLSYCLGAGIGTKAAAESLKKKSINWNTNFFETNKSKYTEGGGNGAAMRIQPHVWSSKPSANERNILLDILKDSIVTHGHPVALVGAAFHALFLKNTLNSKAIPEFESWSDLIRRTSILSEIAENDDDLSLLWLPEWERRNKKIFSQAIQDAIKDMLEDYQEVKDHLQAYNSESPESLYVSITKKINALDKNFRGSGAKTSLLAAVLSILFKENALKGLVVSANLLGSDTDTIATMAGAILGIVSKKLPPENVQDQEYLIHQADRMVKIRNGLEMDSHQYPDMLSWNPPKNNLDMITKNNGKLFLVGFGEITPVGDAIDQKGKAPTMWQEFKTNFNQKIIVKRRKKPNEIQGGAIPNVSPSKGRPVVEQHEMMLIHEKHKPVENRVTVDQATDEAIKSGFSPEIVGGNLMKLAIQDNCIEHAIAYAAIIAKAKIYREKRK